MNGTPYLTLSAAALAVHLSGAGAIAQDLETQTLEEVAQAAQEEGTIVWYESIPLEEAEEVMNDFLADYPDLEFNYVTVGGSQRLARVTQESLGGGPTADVLTDVAGSVMMMADRGFVRAVDWEKLGVEPGSENAPNEYMLRTNAAVYVTLYNTNLVDEADVPKTYDDLLDEKYTGQWGTWARPNGIVNLLPAWGEEQTREYVEALAETRPTLYRNPQAAAEAVGAGEIAMAHFEPYHTALPTIEKGAPVAVAFLEPVPVASLYGYLPEFAEHPNAGKLFLSWLASPEGAASVERATGRGSPFSPGTEMSATMEGMEVSTLTAEEESGRADEIGALENEIAEMLRGH
ncbi:ABC transporter substrate-binding protein [Celeribacter indicus]|uniref:ABC transporter substrate-binding protein n=1 Tax=Celeribacter indicus TaxID=1208324 RepID=A0A0B5E2T7_9RHOB|nr:extracellular solute-binding protein [Celeribacter indicus]AJE46762.1 ABC transporter substrate-binding protein [Celeribacter indicus]SDX05813.1 iron(III) transport system substrate-binding protein [Celeribacter indicus]